MTSNPYEIIDVQAFEPGKVYLLNVSLTEDVGKDTLVKFAQNLKEAFNQYDINVIINFSGVATIKAQKITDVDDIND